MNGYLDNIDEILAELLSKGYVRLPSIKNFGLDDMADLISHDMQGATFKELSPNHKSFIDSLGITEILAPKLHEVAAEKFKYTGAISDQYHVARRVEPGNSREFYRGHFDSHLFTLVLPIKIPQDNDSGCSIGELLFFPFARSEPKNEFSNFFQKLWFRLCFSSKAGLERLSRKTPMRIELFDDYQPLLFLGNTFFHTNRPVSENASSYRLTLLSHFYDPSPKYGIGNILRILRSR